MKGPGSGAVPGDDPPDRGSELLASRTRLRGQAPQEATVDLREPAPAPSDWSALDDPLRPLVGKVAVVTGGGSGVGRAVALALVEAGARVTVIDRDVQALRETTAAAGADATVVFLQCDLGSLSEVSGAADFIARLDRPVDVLVHCAEVRVRHGLRDGVVADLDEQYLVNLRGPYLLTQHLLPQLEAGPGHVVFLDSDASAHVHAGDTQFAMTKSGLGAMAEGLREELGAAGVRVTTVHSGPVAPGSSASHGPRGDSLLAIDVADCVLGALEMPARVEITDLHLRPRSIAF